MSTLTDKSYRDFGVDLLKIVAMLMVVATHILTWGGFGLSSPPADNLKSIILHCTASFCLCAVNCFVLASGWILASGSVKYNRIVKLWLIVVFYSVLFLILGSVCGLSLGFRDYLRAFFPIMRNSYWFFTAYIGMMLLAPIVNFVVMNIDEKVAVKCVIFIFCGWSLLPFLSQRDVFLLNGGYSMIWFVFLYAFAGLIKRFGWFSKFSKQQALFALVVVTVVNVLAVDLLPIVIQNLHFDFGNKLRLSISYNTPTVLIAAVAMLRLFVGSKIHARGFAARMIIFISVSIFSVYIIHSNWIFRKLTNWNANWTQFLSESSVIKCVLALVIVPVLILVVCILIDKLRKTLFSLGYKIFSKVVNHD